MLNHTAKMLKIQDIFPRLEQNQSLVFAICFHILLGTSIARWGFQIFFIFTPIWRRFPIWLIFFRWVETTKQIGSQVLQASSWKAKRLKDESDPNWERSEKLSPSNRDPVLNDVCGKKDGHFAISLRWLRWITSKTTEIYRWWCHSDDFFLYL